MRLRAGRAATLGRRSRSWSSARPRCCPSTRRADLTKLVVRETVGLGPLEELSADPAVEEVMVNGHGSVYVERRGADRATPVSSSRPTTRYARRSSASSRRPAARRRALADGRRTALRRVTRERRRATARGGRARHLHPPLWRRASRARRAGRLRLARTACRRDLGGGGTRRAHRPHHGRHRIGEDDAPQCSLGVDRRRRSA